MIAPGDLVRTIIGVRLFDESFFHRIGELEKDTYVFVLCLNSNHLTACVVVEDKVGWVPIAWLSED